MLKVTFHKLKLHIYKMLKTSKALVIFSA